MYETHQRFVDSLYRRRRIERSGYKDNNGGNGDLNMLFQAAIKRQESLKST